MVQDLGPQFINSVAAARILDSLSCGQTLIMKIVQQLSNSIKSAVNIILLSMHREPGLNGEKALSNGPSLFMKELQEFLHRVWNLHMAPFNDKHMLALCGREMAERCIELFVRNVAIFRPISQHGRNRLKTDCHHLEATLNPIAGDLATLGRPFRLLHSLATLITMSPENLSAQTTETDGSVPPYIVLFLLFGHAGNDLTSPHTAAGWPNDKVIIWLDEHQSEKER